MFKILGEIFKIITNLPVFIATIKIAVVTAEDSTTSSGAQKRDAVIKAIITSMKSDFGIDLTGLESGIETVVNIIVSVYNDLGIFTHSVSTSTTSTK